MEIQGFGGNDYIVGSDFDDRVFGGPGNDTVLGEAGIDYVIDYNQQSDSDSLASAAGLSKFWEWEAGISQSTWNNLIYPDGAWDFSLHEVSEAIDEIVPDAQNNLSFGPSNDQIQASPSGM